MGEAAEWGAERGSAEGRGGRRRRRRRRRRGRRRRRRRRRGKREGLALVAPPRRLCAKADAAGSHSSHFSRGGKQRCPLQKQGRQQRSRRRCRSCYCGCPPSGFRLREFDNGDGARRWKRKKFSLRLRCRLLPFSNGFFLLLQRCRSCSEAAASSADLLYASGLCPGEGALAPSSSSSSSGGGDDGRRCCSRRRR